MQAGGGDFWGIFSKIQRFEQMIGRFSEPLSGELHMDLCNLSNAVRFLLLLIIIHAFDDGRVRAVGA